MQPSPQSALYSYDSIQFNQTRYQMIQQDVDIAFLQNMFDGDLSQGLTMLQVSVLLNATSWHECVIECGFYDSCR
jgi:hypothetical protein